MALVAGANKVAKSLGKCFVIGLADPVNAGSRALSNFSQQTWAPGSLRPLVDPRRAASHRVNPQQRIKSVSDGPALCVGSEIANSRKLSISGYKSARRFVLHRNSEIRVGLIIAKPHVKRGLKFLDPSEFELERLIFTGNNGPFHIAGTQKHPLGAFVQRFQWPKVV